MAPKTTYPRANTAGLVNGQTAEAIDVLNAITPLDRALEDLRIGWLEFGQIRFDPGSTLTVAAGAITITNSYHLITAATYQTLTTINGANAGDMLYLELASGSAGDVLIGDYLLESTGQAIWIMKENIGFTVIGSSGVLVRSSARAYRATSVQAINTGTPTKLQLNATSWNQNGPAGTAVFDATTNYRYSPGKVGYYHFDIQVNWASAIGAGTYILLFLYKNGIVMAQATFRGDGNIDFTTQLSLTDWASAAGDYYEVFVQQNDGAARNVQFGSIQTWMTATLLHG